MRPQSKTEGGVTLEGAEEVSTVYSSIDFYLKDSTIDLLGVRGNMRLLDSNIAQFVKESVDASIEWAYEDIEFNQKLKAVRELRASDKRRQEYYEPPVHNLQELITEEEKLKYQHEDYIREYCVNQPETVFILDAMRWTLLYSKNPNLRVKILRMRNEYRDLLDQEEFDKD